jgi:hypothetical protein
VFFGVTETRNILERNTLCRFGISRKALPRYAAEDKPAYALAVIDLHQYKGRN